MASIEVRNLPSGARRYVVRYRTTESLSRQKSFVRRRDAESFLVHVESSKRSGSFVDPTRATVTVGAWAQLWLEGKSNLAPTTRERYEGIVASHVVPRWGPTRLSQVTHASVQGWLASMDAAPATIRKAHTVFSMLLDYAVKDGRLAKNPARGVSLPRIEQTEKRFLTAAQVEHLAEACGPGYALLVRFLAYTGLRWGEMAALRVRRVDLKRGRLAVAESVTPVRGVMTFGPTKGHERREVALPPFSSRNWSSTLGRQGKR